MGDPEIPGPVMEGESRNQSPEPSEFHPAGQNVSISKNLHIKDLILQRKEGAQGAAQGVMLGVAGRSVNVI